MNPYSSYILSQGGDEDEISDDELPPDVDLSDPFFAEELGAAGERFKKTLKSNESLQFMEEDHET